MDHRAKLELLDQTPVFSQLSESDLNRLAGLFRATAYANKTEIFTQGDVSDRMYIVCEGSVDLQINKKDGEKQFAHLKRGDYFGEEALLFDDPRYYSAVANGETILLWLHVDHFLSLYEDFQAMDAMLEISIRSRKLSTEISLPWLQADEFVHLLERRHPAILFSRWLAPAVLSLASVFFSVMLQVVWLPDRNFGWVLLAIGLLIGAAWAVWSYFDWRNDYFAITNKRVVWIEKIALIYESRQEAPLRTIMSVGIQRTRLGSLLGFSDVVVETYVGTIRLRDLENGEPIAALVESYWHGSDWVDQRDETRAMEEMLSEKIDPAWNRNNDTQVSATRRIVQETQKAQPEPGFFGWLFSDFIRLRYEADGVIIYRKHWFVLIRKTWLPVVLLAAAIVVLAVRLGGALAFLPITATVAMIFIFMFVVFLWMVYQYADWRNDVFMLTLDQVIDLDRKPLGKIRRRSAPLENVLSIEYERLGFWGFLFNFGTVYISVGNTRLSFDHVYNPSAVQQDIFYRMGERLEKVRQFEVDSERERVSNWLASYHRKAESMRRMRGEDTFTDEDL